jgi:uncharacterized phage-associated protein
MASVHDVAAYILKTTGEISTWKLQKLVYYSQAWHCVWDERELFSEPIQAWANGPVVPALFHEHRGSFRVASWPKGKASKLSLAQRESIDVVVRHYGRSTGFALREMTHSESPWRNARKGVSAGEPSTNVISLDSMAEYYASL